MAKKKKAQVIALETGKIIDKPKLGRPIKWTAQRIEIERQALEEWIAKPDSYYVLSFSLDRGYEHLQLQRFAEMSPSFCKTYSRAKEIQEQRIVENSLNRKFDGNFAKFVLQNKAGWRERSEVAGDQANPLSFILDRVGAKAKDPIQLEHDGKEIDISDDS